MPDLHARFSPSASSRWMNCTAAPMAEAEHPEDGSSDAADKGTCYHEVAEVMLTRLTFPINAARKVTKAESKKAFALAYDFVQTNGTSSVPAERALMLMNVSEAEDSAKAYVDWILQHFGKAISEGAAFKIEGRSQINAEMWGTVDFHIVAGSTLHIIDLKTGRWPVGSKDNLQLLTYAAGLATSHIEKVCLTIFQDGRNDSTMVDLDVVRKHYTRIIQVHKEALDGGEFKPGDHCKFCRAKNHCQAFSDRGLEVAKREFGAIEDLDPLSSISNMDSDTAVRMLNAYAIIEGWMAAALPLLTDRAFNEGLELPGFKVIRGRKNKAWQDKDEAGKIMGRKLGDKAFKKTILTPNQMIKIAGEKECEGLWTIPTGEVKLVTEATRGKAITNCAAIEFADEGEE